MEFVVLVAVVVIFIIIMIVLGEHILVSSIMSPKKSAKKISDIYKRFPNENRFTVNSSTGIPISFVYIPVDCDDNIPKKIVFIFHGYNSSGESVRKYASVFMKAGFSVIIPDNRFCGNSGGNYLGLASLDAEDSIAIFKWIKDCFPVEIPVGLFGESFGAAQAILLASSEIAENISFVISDSSFSDLYAFLKERVRADYRIKAFPLLTIALHVIKKKYGISIKSISPLKSLSSCGGIPMFFIHGEDDTFILPQMSIDLYNAKSSGYKKFYLAEGAAHCSAYDVDPEGYEDKIDEFLNKINV